MARPPSKPLPLDQEEFEDVLVSLICGQNPDLAAIVLEQWRFGEKIERWGSGVGFFTTVLVMPEAPKLPGIGSRELVSYDAMVDYGVPTQEQIAITHDFSHEQSRKGQAIATLHHDGERITELECVACGHDAVWPETRYEYMLLTDAGMH
jgi:hypothetical protein